ncbi:MAG: hypothetical protein AAFY72_03280 [Cyanobacteria bacterium J06649_4]
MSPDVSQWLAEVRSLQQQVSELQQERERAYASVENWRKRYEAEAQQRRRDIDNYNRKIKRLKQSLAEFQSAAQNKDAQLQTEINAIQDTQSVEQLRAQLVTSKTEVDRLKGLLKAEQTEHEQTRASLTAALSDAVDLLAKERLAAGE